MKHGIIGVLTFFIFLASTGKTAAQTDEKEIEEVVLRSKEIKYKNKKENPAYAIMQEVWKRNRTNGLEKYSSYTFDEYEKIEFVLNNIDSTLKDKKLF